MTLGMKVKRSDGTWAGGVGEPNQVDDHSSSTDITPPDGARFCFFELVAAGGGGNWSGANSTGGAGGQYTPGFIVVSQFTWPQSLTIGAGGAVETKGGDTSFCGCTAEGGEAGNGNYNRSVGGGWGWLSPSSNPNPRTSSNSTGGGFGSSANNNVPAYSSSLLGAGGGVSDQAATGGKGGTSAIELGRLKAGDGGYGTTDATAPGGGGQNKKPGARGGARLTWIF